MPEPDPSVDGLADLEPDVRARAWRFLHLVKRLESADFQRVALPATEVRARAAARADAHGAVNRAGLGRLESETRRAARDTVESGFVGEMYQPTMFGLNWGRSTGQVADRLALIAAVEDAALATVARDVIPPSTYDELMEPFEWIAGVDRTSVPTYRPGGVARWTRPIAIVILGALGSVLVLVSMDLGFPGMLSILIPTAMVIWIVASLARRRPGPTG